MSDRTYTYGTTPHDVIERALPRIFEMRLTRADMHLILDGLAVASEVAGAAGEPYTTMRTTILDVIGIEEV